MKFKQNSNTQNLKNNGECNESILTENLIIFGQEKENEGIYEAMNNDNYIIH